MPCSFFSLHLMPSFNVLKFFWRFVAVLVAAFVTSVLHAQTDQKPTDAAAGVRFFESNVRPVFVKHCYECHSKQSGTAEGGLRLDARQAIRTGGDRGPAVVPGSPEKSPLMIAVTHSDPDLKMPPQKSRLADSVIADLRKWIEMGAPDPREEATEELASVRRAGLDFWAYQPPRLPLVPRAEGDVWSRRDVDLFVLSTLRSQGLVPSSDADMPTLIRRLYFDLIGLPPSDYPNFGRGIVHQSSTNDTAGRNKFDGGALIKLTSHVSDSDGQQRSSFRDNGPESAVIEKQLSLWLSRIANPAFPCRDRASTGKEQSAHVLAVRNSVKDPVPKAIGEYHAFSNRCCIQNRVQL